MVLRFKEPGADPQRQQEEEEEREEEAGGGNLNRTCRATAPLSALFSSEPTGGLEGTAAFSPSPFRVVSFPGCRRLWETRMLVPEPCRSFFESPCRLGDQGFPFTMPGAEMIVPLLLLTVGLCQSLPHYTYDDMDDDLAMTFDYYKDTADADYRNGSACEECMPELCPETRGCRAGLVRDSCGCCFECGNLEGQSCDPGDRNVQFGICGEDMQCKMDPRQADYEDGGDPDAQCVCNSQEPLCGSDGKTYMNLCKFKEAAFMSPGLNVSDGPCRTVPMIKVPPRNLVNMTGSSVVFLCEVFAFPMALVDWSKDGKEVILPGDDPHISVQNPVQYMPNPVPALTGSGGGTDEMSAYMEENIKELSAYDQMRYYDGDYY
ncbi:hypothetical protein NFI96_022550 [Prochilodus magdalenae]|nr:hypothetical protein NFI96_022550 [Prochilodus magdalenae]